jgi:hypothetical protein
MRGSALSANTAKLRSAAEVEAEAGTTKNFAKAAASAAAAAELAAVAAAVAAAMAAAAAVKAAASSKKVAVKNLTGKKMTRGQTSGKKQLV